MFARKEQKRACQLLSCAGILSLVLRLVLDGFFTDEKGLIPGWHPLSILLWVIAGAALALALLAAWKLEPNEGYGSNFPGSFPGLLGHLLCAGGILATLLATEVTAPGTIGTAWTLLGYGSIPCLALAGWFRFQNRQPFFGLHLCPALFLLMHIVSQYQSWSSQTQLQSYFFTLAGLVSLMFFAFYRCAFDAGLPWRRRLSFFSFACLCLLPAAIAGPSSPWLYLGGFFWVLTDRPAPAPRRRRRRPFTEEV